MEKPIEKISIREITDNCKLNRQTFYYHFIDIYDQLEWLYEQEVIALFGEYEGENLWKEGLLRFLNYCEENKKMCYNTLKSSGREYLFKCFYHDLYRIFRGTIDALSGDLEMSDEYKNMLTEYYVFSFGGIAENWVYGNIEQSPKELVDFIDTMLHDQINGITLRYKA